MAGVPVALPQITTMTTGQRYGVGTPNYTTPTYDQIKQRLAPTPPPVTSMDTRDGPAAVALTKPTDSGKVAVAPPTVQGGPAPVVTPPGTPPPQTGGYVAPTSGFYQQSLDLAENSRNFNNSYQGSMSPAVATGTSGGEGGNGGLRTYDFSQNTPGMHDWTGPDAYGLQGMKNGQEYGDGNQDQIAADLARIRQFDPNATVTAHHRETGGEGGGVDQIYYTMDFDESKLPKAQYANASGVGNYGNQHNVYSEDDKNFRFDPHYGVMTDPRNLKPDAPDWFDKYGSMLPLIAAGIMTGGAAFGPGVGLALQAPRLIGSAVNGTLRPWDAARVAAGVSGVPYAGTAVNLAHTGYNYATRGGG